MSFRLKALDGFLKPERTIQRKTSLGGLSKHPSHSLQPLEDRFTPSFVVLLYVSKVTIVAAILAVLLFAVEIKNLFVPQQVSHMRV